MRTIVEIPSEQVELLDRLCKREKMSRAEAVRRAVANLLHEHRESTTRAFGLWADRGVDSLDYQETLRREWDR